MKTNIASASFVGLCGLLLVWLALNLLQLEPYNPPLPQTLSGATAEAADGPGTQPNNRPNRREDQSLSPKTINGRVLDPLGNGLEGVIVYLVDPDKRPEFTSPYDFLLNLERVSALSTKRSFYGGLATYTANRGRFTFQDPPTNKNPILAAWSPRVGHTIQRIDTDFRKPFVLYLQNYTAIHGTVHDPDKVPITHAQVSIYCPPRAMPVYVADVDSAGRYSSPALPPATYALTALATRYHNSPARILSVALNEPDERLDFVLERQVLFSAFLLNSARVEWTLPRIAQTLGFPANEIDFFLTVTPIARRRDVDTFPSPQTQLRLVKKDGRLSLEGYISDNKATILSSWHRASKLGESSIRDLSIASVVHDFHTSNTIGIQISLSIDITPSVTTIPTIEVLLADRRGPLGEELYPLARATGRRQLFTLHLEPIAGAQTVWLIVRASGFAEHFSPISLVSVSGYTSKHVTLLPCKGNLRGTVVDIHNNPIHEAIVTLADSTGAYIRAPRRSRQLTDSHGRFSFTNLPARQAVLYVRARGFACRSFNVQTARTDSYSFRMSPGRRLTVLLPTQRGIHFRVLDGNDRPYADDRLSGLIRYGKQCEIIVPYAAKKIAAYLPHDNSIYALTHIGASDKVKFSK